MKAISLCFSFIIVFLSCNISSAQNSILAGKIVDENNKAMHSMRISVIRNQHLIQEIPADTDGIYCSQPLEAGTYRIDVVSADGSYKSKNLSIDTTAGSSSFYIIKIADNKITIDKTSEDPSLKVKMGKIMNDSRNESDGGHSYFAKDPNTPKEKTERFFIKKDTTAINSKGK